MRSGDEVQSRTGCDRLTVNCKSVLLVKSAPLVKSALPLESSNWLRFSHISCLRTALLSFYKKGEPTPSVLMSTHDIKAYGNVMSLSTNSTNFVWVSGCIALVIVHTFCSLSKNHIVYLGLYDCSIVGTYTAAASLYHALLVVLSNCINVLPKPPASYSWHCWKFPTGLRINSHKCSPPSQHQHNTSSGTWMMLWHYAAWWLSFNVNGSPKMLGMSEQQVHPNAFCIQVNWDRCPTFPTTDLYKKIQLTSQYN